MNEHSLDQIEQRLQRAAANLRYPPTPDLAARRQPKPRRAPRLAWGLTALLLVVALLAAPPVRAQLVDWLRIGGVQIAPTAESADLSETGVYSLDELSGEMSLEAAREAVDFPLALPAGWGPPERVFVQQMDEGRYFAILAWGAGDTPDLVLYVIGPGVELAKGPPQILTELEVDGRPAAYVQGEHLLVAGGFHQFGVLVSGPALVWEGAGGLTYRLEADLSMDDMVRIAESIR